MLTSFAAETITHFETFKDKCCELVFTHKSRNFLQSNPFVLEIASFHDDLMHSSFSPVSIGLGMLAHQNTKNVSNWNTLSGPTELNWTFQTFHVYELLTSISICRIFLLAHVFLTPAFSQKAAYWMCYFPTAVLSWKLREITLQTHWNPLLLSVTT